MTNPYAHDRQEQEFATPDYAPEYHVPGAGSFAVPSLESGSPYNDEQGWTASLRLGPTGVPDTTRLGTTARQSAIADTGVSVEQFYGPLDADKARRSSVEFQDADGWEETKHFPGYSDPSMGANRWAPNPRRVPPPEPRPTSRMAPRTYLFTRPFMTGNPKSGARSLSGMHFSMADHRRKYDILGMAPARSPRNTFRLDPTPWDAGIVDMPPNTQPTVQDLQEVPVTVEVAYSSRNWRL